MIKWNSLYNINLTFFVWHTNYYLEERIYVVGVVVVVVAVVAVCTCFQTSFHPNQNFSRKTTNFPISSSTFSFYFLIRPFAYFLMTITNLGDLKMWKEGWQVTLKEIRKEPKNNLSKTDIGPTAIWDKTSLDSTLA